VAVAVAGGDVVGFAVTTTGFGLEDGLIAELTDLFVVPACRGVGGLVAMYGRWGFVDGGRRLLVCQVSPM
jgi:aminoglycoside 6'-N-acetyltransferase I